MMAPEYYTFTGRNGEVIPDHVTHVLIDKALKFVRARAFQNHPRIVEVICHNGVEKIEGWAFHNCPWLRRVIMPGVKVVEQRAFQLCMALTYIECGKLERIGQWAFCDCKSLRSIDLPSIKIVERNAFAYCNTLVNAKFGKDLESLGERAFDYCLSLERITLPLKDGVVTDNFAFSGCYKLNHVDLVGGVHDTIDALLIEEWKNDMNEEIDTISQILPNTSAGNMSGYGEKARTIRTWISSLLRKYNNYKAEHRRYLNEATAALQPALPNDIVLKNVMPFVELPSYTFDGEN